MELYNWRKQVEDSGANKARKSISLILVDEEGKDSCRWDILEAWPTKYSSSGFEAKGNAIMIETFELALEKITRTK
jgi:phage tail-like protein